MSARRRCRGCGATWAPTARWCGSCGRPLTDPAAAPAAVPASGPAAIGDHPTSRSRAALGTMLVVGVLLAVALLTRPGGTGETGEVAVALPPAPVAAAPDPAGPGGAIETIAEGPRCRGEREVVPCVVWDVPAPAAARVATRVVGHLVVVVGPDGTVTARGITDGRVVWSAAVELFPSSSRVRVLEQVGSSIPVQVDGRVTFLATDDGRELWSGAAPLQPDLAVRVGAWLVIGDGRRLANLSSTGTTTWQLEPPPDVLVQATAHGLYLITTDGVVERVSADGGGTVWRRDLGASARALPTRIGGRTGLFAVDGPAPALLGIDTGNGREVLRWDLDGPVVDAAVDGQRFTVVVDGPRGLAVHLATADRDGVLVPTGSRPIAATTTGLRPVVVADQRVAVAASNPSPSVTVIGRDPRRSSVHALPVVPYGVAFDGPDALLVATVNGIDAIDARTSTHRWRVQLRDATLLGEEGWQPPVVAHRRGISRLTTSAVG